MNESKNIRHLNKSSQHKYGLHDSYQNYNKIRNNQFNDKIDILGTNNQNLRNQSYVSFQCDEYGDRKYRTKRYIKNSSVNQFTTIQDKQAFTQEIGVKSVQNSETGRNKEKKSNAAKQRSDENNIQISQFTIEQQHQKLKQKHSPTIPHQQPPLPSPQTDNQNNTQLLANVNRIIDCKNKTASLLNQVQIYIKIIQKLKKQNFNYRSKLEFKLKQNRQLRDLVHVKDMEIVEICQDNQRIRRMYALQSAKLRVIRESYVQADGDKLQAVIRQSGNEVYENDDEQVQNSINTNCNIVPNQIKTDHKSIRHQSRLANNKIPNKNAEMQMSNCSKFAISGRNVNEYQNPQIQLKKNYHQQTNLQCQQNDQQNINISKLLQKSNGKDGKISGRIIKRSANYCYRFSKNHDWKEEQSTVI